VANPSTRSIPERTYDSSKYFYQNYDVYSSDPVYEPLKLQPNEENFPSKASSFEESDQRKYTFGKIEIDPISAYQQYNKAQEREGTLNVSSKAKSRPIKGS
jgi:hypothetical protein